MAESWRNRWSTLLVVALIGTLVPFVASSATAQSAPTVLMVAGNANPPRADRPAHDALRAAGYAVRVVDDDAVRAADASEVDVVVVTSSVQPAVIGSMFAATPTPVVTSESYLHDDFGLTAGSRAARGDAGSQRSLDIVDPSHPIAGGTTGSVAVTNAATSFAFGVPLSSADVVARLPGTADRAGVFAYDTGDQMVNRTAPARRVGMFMSVTAGRDANDAGLGLLVRAVDWARGGSTSTTDDGPTTTVQTTNDPPASTDTTTTTTTTTTTAPSGTGDTGSSTPTSGQTVLMVAGSTGPPPPDRVVREALRDAGFTVRVVDDDVATAADASGVDVVYITSSVTPSKVATTFTSVRVPVVSSEAYLHDDLGFTANSAAARADTGSLRTLEVVASGHPIAGGRSGALGVASGDTPFAFGRPAASADVIARLPGTTDRAGVFAYDAGDAMVRGTAPARRVGLFLSYATGSRLTTEGRALVVRAVQWAVGAASSNPVTSDPVTGDPGAGDPGTGDPETSDPGAGDPGTSDPPATSTDPIVAYDFTAGSGSVVRDTSGASPALDLRITRTTGSTWVPGGLRLDGRASLATVGGAQRLTDAAQRSGAITLEAWVTPDSARSAGPGVVVGLATSAQQRSIVLSQGYWPKGPTDRFEGMLRVGTTNVRLTAPRGSVDTTPTHLVLRRLPSGRFSLWIDGTKVADRASPASLAEWNDSFPLVVGADADGRRGFRGTIHEITLYGHGLSDTDIRAQAAQGPPEGVGAVDVGGSGGGDGDAGDGSSGTPPVIDVWYGADQRFGTRGVPQRWVNVLGRARDADGLASASYRLNGGPSRSLSLGPDDRRLVDAGDFNVDLHIDDLRSGVNTVEIAVTDRLGAVATTTVTVRWQPTSAPAIPFTIDWGGVSSIGDAVQVVDGKWNLNRAASTVRVAPGYVGYDRILAIGDTDWTTYDVRTSATVHDVLGQIGPFSAAPGFGFIAHWNGHNDSVAPGSQPLQGFRPDSSGDPTPLGALAWWRGGEVRIQNHRVKIADAGEPFAVVEGGAYQLRLRVTKSGDRVRYQIKVWNDGRAEPAAWQADWTSLGQFDEPGSGALVLFAHEVELSFGDVQITRS